MELPDGFVVGQAVVMPENTDGAVARSLRSALTEPAVGSPRQPDLKCVERQLALRFTLDVRAGKHVGPAVRTARRQR